MTDQKSIKQILTAYKLEESVLAEDLSSEEVLDLCSKFEAKTGERLLAYYCNTATRTSFENGVLLTDKRIIWGKIKLSTEIELHKFSHDEIKFVLDDIELSSLPEKIILPDGRFFKIFHNRKTFIKLLKRLYPELEKETEKYGVIVTENLEKEAKQKKTEEEEETKKEFEERTEKGIKGALVIFGIFAVFSILLMLKNCVEGMSSSDFFPSNDKGKFSESDICRATISNVMGRPLSIVKAIGKFNDHYRLTYVRSYDNSRWNFRCKIKGGRAIWASENGPWRTRGGDAPVYWNVSSSGNTLNIREKYNDGSENRKTYYKSSF